MKRIVLAFLIAGVFSLSSACKKEEPGPTPEPTPAVEPTAVPGPSHEAACYTPMPAGSPPYCKNAAGDHVTCPGDASSLPTCD